MTKKIVAVLMAALTLLAVVACTPQAADSPPETTVAEPAAERPMVDETPTVAQVAEEPPTPTAAPTNTAPPEPTEAPVEESTDAEIEGETEEVVEDDQPEEAAVAEDAPVQFGRTEEGAWFYGSPTAEITLIDHSDFL